MFSLTNRVNANKVPLNTTQEAPDFASASVTQILSFLRVNPDTGLACLVANDSIKVVMIKWLVQAAVNRKRTNIIINPKQE